MTGSGVILPQRQLFFTSLIGGSCIIAPTGEIAALAVSVDDEVVTHRVDLELIAACRQVNFDFTAYRRPGEYGLIAQRAGPVWNDEEV